MKALIVYDSYFGNTEDVAIAIGNALKDHMKVNIKRVSKLDPKLVKGVDFLVIGSPTRAFQATRKVREFLKGISKEEYAHMKVIAFDTRIASEDTDSKMLNRMTKAFGYAAKPMGEIMKKRGAKLLVDPVGFYVKDTEGPLKEGEEERAATWARQAVENELS